MFLFSTMYQGPALTLEDEELDDEEMYESEESDYKPDDRFKKIPYTEPLGKEGLKKKLREIFEEEID